MLAVLRKEERIRVAKRRQRATDARGPFPAIPLCRIGGQGTEKASLIRPPIRAAHGEYPSVLLGLLFDSYMIWL
jgi:hypothetical protein